MTIIQIPDWLMPLLDDPERFCYYACLGMIVPVLSVGLLLFIKPLRPIITPLFYALSLTWISGFIVFILCAVMEIPTIKQLIIWLIMFFSFLIFCIIQRKAINKHLVFAETESNTYH